VFVPILQSIGRKVGTANTHTGRGGGSSGLITHTFIEWTVIAIIRNVLRRCWNGAGRPLLLLTVVTAAFVHEARFKEGTALFRRCLFGSGGWCGRGSRCCSISAAVAEASGAATTIAEIVKVKVGCRVWKVEYEGVGHLSIPIAVLLAVGYMAQVAFRRSINGMKGRRNSDHR